MTDNTSLERLMNEKLSSEELAWDHAMEISGSVYRRMQELGLKSKDLAARMGVSPARVSRILSGEQSMTLSTLARLETALELDMSQGFSHPVATPAPQHRCLIIPFPNARADESSSCTNWAYQIKEG